MGKLRVGVIGLGVGSKHVDAYQLHPSVEVVKICDINNDRLQEAISEHTEINGVSDPEEILDDKYIDVVSIASYDNYHCEQILRALNNGKHVYVEKPMCLFDDEAKSIRALLNLKPELQLSSNLVLRTCPRFIRLKEAIASGEMGDIYSLQANYLWGRKHKLTDGWRKDMKFYSIIHGAAVHMIDLLIWITNMLPVEVKAYGNDIATKDSDMKYNDFASILLKYETGLIAEVSVHGGCVHPHFHDVRVYGTKSTFINGITEGVWINSESHDIQPIKEEYPAKAERGNTIRTFIDSIVDKSLQPIVRADDIFNAMSICFAAERAVHKNANVRIEYI
jgi:predicted dehydrogenase